MVDLSTEYLGLRLAHPLLPGASPLAHELDSVRRLEDAGAAAIVMHSLFEEQIEMARQAKAHDFMRTADADSQALSYFPMASEFPLGPDEYFEHVARIRSAVSVPVIASLNGVTPSGWLENARRMEQAGASAIELNVYFLPTDPDESSADVEGRALECARIVESAVSIPFAVKLSPFYSALPRFARDLAAAGADGVVLFNRAYQPDIDVDDLEVVPSLHLSDSSELRLRLRWLAVLSDRVPLDLSCSGGVHSGLDAAKAILAGAHTVQVVSTLLRHGPRQLAVIRSELEALLERREYESVAQMRGSMNLDRCPDPSAFERANYARILQSWRG